MLTNQQHSRKYSPKHHKSALNTKPVCVEINKIKLTYKPTIVHA